MFQMVPYAIHCEASSGLQAGAIGNLFVSPISWKLGVRCAIWELLVARISGRFHDDFGRMSYEQIGKQGENMEHTWGQIFPLTLGAGNWEWWNLRTLCVQAAQVFIVFIPSELVTTAGGRKTPTGDWMQHVHGRDASAAVSFVRFFALMPNCSLVRALSYPQ